jgi:hypothetical protein
MSAVLKSSVVSITPARLRKQVDKYITLAAQIKALETEASELKAAFKAYGDGVYKGTDRSVAVSTSPVTRLDAGEVKARLTPAQYIECVVINDVTRVTIK